MRTDKGKTDTTNQFPDWQKKLLFSIGKIGKGVIAAINHEILLYFPCHDEKTAKLASQI